MTTNVEEVGGGGGIEGKRNRSHGYGQQYGNCLGEEAINGLLGKGEKRH